MRYDDEKISWIIAARRRAFKIRCIIISSAILSLLCVSVVNISDYLTVLCSILMLPLLFRLLRLIKKFDASTLMKGEIRGKNIKEYEYSISGSTGQARIYRRTAIPFSFANKKAPPLRLNGTVYLELEDGNVTSISGLYKSHMDIYEDGDILLKYAGTRFPIVVSRDVKKQPCPLCGEVNDKSLAECRGCGLGIVKNSMGDINVWTEH